MVAVWPLINVTARLAGQGPAVIQVGILSELVFLVTGLHETLENTNECDSDSEVVSPKGIGVSHEFLKTVP